QAEHPGEDGSARLLVALRDGQTVESVRLPRGGLCVSTQVGCAVGCAFCMTGTGGLIRQLVSAEIVGQVALARAVRPVYKMGLVGSGWQGMSSEEGGVHGRRRVRAQPQRGVRGYRTARYGGWHL